jgi:hypothetical protein
MTLQNLFATIENYRRRQAALNILAALVDCRDLSPLPTPYNQLMDDLISMRGGHKSNYAEAIKLLEADGFVERVVEIDGEYEPAAPYRTGPRYYKEGTGHLDHKVALSTSPAVLAAFGRPPLDFRMRK